MRSDHRHELKTNELADWIMNFPDWANENRTSLIGAAAVILVALLIYFLSFYRQNIVSARNQERLTSLVTQVPQQMNRVANAATQNTDESYALLPAAQDLQDFAAKSSNADMAALALIQRGAALRAEVHYRLAEVSREELATQIGKAKESYQQALDRKPSSPALAAAAQYGLGLCEEELGNFDQAAAIYREVAQKPEYAGTTAQAEAAYRLKIMDDFKTAVVFQPAPPKPAPAQATAPSVQIKPGDGKASAPVVQIKPSDGKSPAVTVPVAPAPAGDAKTNAAPAAPAPSSDTKTNAAPAPAAPAPTPAPAPAPAPAKSDTNAPKSN
ncbi:MAG: tetratricopeptide repeat protein [Planctomycetes bacterium]|nr:tetratricopeptide repeat protein [Planctomycetota bacterium]